MSRPSAPPTGSVTLQLRDVLNHGSTQWNGIQLKGRELIAVDHRQAQAALNALHEWLLGMSHLSFEGRQQLREQLAGCAMSRSTNRRSRLNSNQLGLLTPKASLSQPVRCRSAISWTDVTGQRLGTRTPLKLDSTSNSIRPLAAVLTAENAIPPWVTTLTGILQGSRAQEPTIAEMRALFTTLLDLEGPLMVRTHSDISHLKQGRTMEMPGPSEGTMQQFPD